MTDALYSQFDRQLDELRRSGQTNYVERIAVLGSRIVEYRQDQVNDILTVELRTRIVDYTLEDATGALVSGSKTAEKFMTYEWTLIRSKDMVTPAADEVREIHCPNCGAPVAINKSAQCEYCGQVLEISTVSYTHLVGAHADSQALGHFLLRFAQGGSCVEEFGAQVRFEIVLKGGSHDTSLLLIGYVMSICFHAQFS